MHRSLVLYIWMALCEGNLLQPSLIFTYCWDITIELVLLLSLFEIIMHFDKSFPWFWLASDIILTSSPFY